jgi:cytochrome oxidase Cu insertion factor (SCO1/SenC/PrrC family)
MPKTKKQKTILEDKDFQDEWIAMTERVVELEHEIIQMTGVIGYLDFQLQQKKDKK